MRYLQLTGIIIFFLVCMPSAVAEETRGKTDACLVTLYNYPAEALQYYVSEKTPLNLPKTLKKNSQVVQPDEKIHSRVNIASQGHANN